VVYFIYTPAPVTPCAEVTSVTPSKYLPALSSVPSTIVTNSKFLLIKSFSISISNIVAPAPVPLVKRYVANLPVLAVVSFSKEISSAPALLANSIKAASTVVAEVNFA
jgi:hypothetical protein